MIPRFVTPLRVEKIGPREWTLTDDLIYRSAILGLVIVKRGYVTDFSSVPRIPFAYWLTGGRGDAAAVIHDYLYDRKEHGHASVSRSTADAVFYEALGAAGPHGPATEPSWARTAMWLGVRAFGWWAWRG